MKIKALKTFNDIKEGQEFDVDDGLGSLLIFQGLAKEVDSKQVENRMLKKDDYSNKDLGKVETKTKDKTKEKTKKK